MKFTIPGEPQGKARGRTFIHNGTGRPTTMTPEKTVLYENLVKTCYQQQCGCNYTEKPLIARIEAFYSIPKSTPKKNIKPMLDGQIRPCKKPDIDNVAKIVLDSLNGIAYKDDTQVVGLQVYKYYAENPCVQVAILEIEETRGITLNGTAEGNAKQIQAKPLSGKEKPMLEKLVGEKIEILPKQPKENQKLCDSCGGTGWLHDKERGFIAKCPVCYDGIINLCPVCHQPKRGVCMNEECRIIRDTESEQKRFDKAVKSELKDVPAEHTEMLYSESYGYNEGYFSDIDEFKEYCEDNDIDIPKYVWSTDKTKLSIDADSIIEQACEELHEDARQNIKDEGELQDFLDAWCAKQTGTDTYSVDYKYAIWTQ